MGQKKFYNEGISFGKLDYTAYFDTDKWGTKLYYCQVGLGTIQGSGPKARRIVDDVTNVFARVDLLGQAMGHNYRIEAKMTHRAPVYVNIPYPDWAYKI